jgi:hypothetical protein
MGTEAELTVPAPIAYATVHRREGWLLFRRSQQAAVRDTQQKL